MRKAVELANSLKPDLTVLTGDYVWRIPEGAEDLAAILSGLNARFGVYSALGNHDIWLDVELVKQAFARHRLPMLVNQGIPLTLGNASLYLAGLDDGWSGNPDLKAALEGAPPQSPVILLYHEPDLADQVSLDPRLTLQLAGHTHGGQVRLPLRGPVILPYLGRKYDYGLYRVNEMWLYTNPGIGMISVPYRYNCPPEVTEFTLAPVEYQGSMAFLGWQRSPESQKAAYYLIRYSLYSSLTGQLGRTSMASASRWPWMKR